MGCGEVIDADLALAFVALLKELLRVELSPVHDFSHEEAQCQLIVEFG
jgi:hypothetical protein